MNSPLNELLGVEAVGPLVGPGARGSAVCMNETGLGCASATEKFDVLATEANGLEQQVFDENADMTIEILDKQRRSDSGADE